MKSLANMEIARYRVSHPMCDDRKLTIEQRSLMGYFEVPVGSMTIRCVVSAAYEEFRWDHVSASCKNRCPSWAEMCAIKEMFFHDHETVMQLHVPRKDWISNHPYCLHLWRPADVEIPRPPSDMVGIKSLGELPPNTKVIYVSNAEEALHTLEKMP